MTVFANRASNVLYDFLTSNHTEGLYLLPANVCPCVPETFDKANQRYEFVDINETHAMDTRQCINRVNKGDCSGVLFVHAYGHPFDNVAFYKQLKQRLPHLIIIDDKCLLSPSFTEFDVHADLTLFSTGYAKYVELGYGGWGIIEDGRTYNRALPQSEYLPLDEELYRDEVLREIPNVRSHKQQINAIYYDQLQSLHEVTLWNNYFDWRYMISVPNDKREAVLKAIFDHGCFAGTNYPSQAMNFKQQICPIAEQEALGVINLFNDFRVNEALAFNVCRAIKEVLS